MANAAPAYRYPERNPRPVAPVRPSVPIQVVPGKGPSIQQQGISSSVVFFAKVIAVIIVAFALLGFVQISLASASVTTSLATEELSVQVKSARTTGSELEVRESTLSNPVYLKSEATKLNMNASSDVNTMILSPDVVATDDQGNLSLAKSLAVLSQG